jgi:membrane-associated protease RseP (regulator of RpoE activity)
LGLAYSASILSILLAHELGHFLMARRLGVTVSYPFFIPVPTLIGTMGAFISMKEPPPNRRALLLIAIAGPLAGLVVTIPVLLIGLSLSEVYSTAALEAMAQEMNTEFFQEGNSLLYAAAKFVVFGRWLPGGGEDVLIHPVAWAGWVGLLVTALNLMPAGQLDGGHIYYALVGPRVARTTTQVVVVVLVVLGIFFWTGWLLWAVLISIFGQYRAPLLNELTPLDQRYRMLALLGVVVFFLVFIPAPIDISLLDILQAM